MARSGQDADSLDGALLLRTARCLDLHIVFRLELVNARATLDKIRKDGVVTGGAAGSGGRRKKDKPENGAPSIFPVAFSGLVALRFPLSVRKSSGIASRIFVALVRRRVSRLAVTFLSSASFLCASSIAVTGCFFASISVGFVAPSR